MIMFPSHHQQNLIKNSSLGGYGVAACGYYDSLINLKGGEVRGSDIMAEDESRTEISINNNDQEDATGTSSSKNIIIHPDTISNKDDDEDDGGWLQLSLGSGHDVHSNRPSSPDHHHQISLAPRLVELDLLTSAGGSASTSSGGRGGGDETWSSTLTVPSQQQLSFQLPDFGPTFFLQPHIGGSSAAIDSVRPISYTHHQQYERNCMPIRPYPLTTISSPSSFSPSLDQLTASSGRPLYFHNVPPIRMDLRVVDPPRRPHSGVWFILQASQNQ